MGAQKKEEIETTRVYGLARDKFVAGSPSSRAPRAIVNRVMCGQFFAVPALRAPLWASPPEATLSSVPQRRRHRGWQVVGAARWLK